MAELLLQPVQVGSLMFLAEPQPCMPRRGLGNGENRPPVLRPGSERAAQLPSRFGNVLRYPDGREERA